MPLNSAKASSTSCSSELASAVSTSTGTLVGPSRSRSLARAAATRSLVAAATSMSAQLTAPSTGQTIANRGFLALSQALTGCQRGEFGQGHWDSVGNLRDVRHAFLARL